MATVLEFNLEEITAPTSDPVLNQKSKELVEKVKSLYLTVHNLQEAKKPVLQSDLKAQHEALKETLREKKKAKSNIAAARDKFTVRYATAYNALEAAQMKLRNVSEAAPNDDDYPSKQEIAAYDKELAAAEAEVAKADEVYKQLSPYVRYWDDELQRLQGDFDVLAMQERNIRVKVKPESESAHTKSMKSISSTLTKLLK